MSINRLVSSRYMVWALLFLPLLAICLQYFRGQLFYGEFIHLTGEWSARLLILTMAVSPLRKAWPSANWTRWLLRQRRYLGLAVFAFALPHLLAYLWKVKDVSQIFAQALEPGLLTGWVATVIFTALAMTSNGASVRWLGQQWKRLHRWIYAAAVLTFLHWILVAYDPISGLIHAAVLLGLQCLRFLPVGKTADS